MYPSIWQILLVLLIILLLFGHKRVRDLGKSLGEALRDFRKGMEDKPTNQATKEEEKKPTTSQDT